MNLLATGPGYTAEHLALLEEAGYSVRVFKGDIERSELERVLPEIDVHILGGSERLDAGALASAGRLKLISFVGTGCADFVDMDAADRLGIEVTRTPGVMSSAVAEHAIGMLIGLKREIFTQAMGARAQSVIRPTQEVSSSTVGIIGMGATGTRVASMLRSAFGCRVIYHSRTRKLGEEARVGMDYVGLEELFADSDTVILAVTMSNDTERMVDARRLALLGTDGILINTANPNLVDPVALRHSLANDEIRAAGFDGYYIEPLPTVEADPHGLLRLPADRFFVTPHTAAKTHQSWTRMVETAVRHALDRAGQLRRAGALQ
jgi:lactate dehydrogenase-like 2-hydroxyacid dehydrogenase